MSKALSLLATLTCKIADGEIKPSHLSAFLRNPHRLLGTLSKEMIVLLPKDATICMVEGKLLSTYETQPGDKSVVRWGDRVWELPYRQIESVQAIKGKLFAHVRDGSYHYLFSPEDGVLLGPYQSIHSFDLIHGRLLMGYRQDSQWYVGWDGKVSGPYPKLIGIEVVDGELAVLTTDQSGEVVFHWRGQKIACPNYYRRGHIIDGKSFYEARRVQGMNDDRWIVWGGWRSPAYTEIYESRMIDGRVFYEGVVHRNLSRYSVVMWGEQELARYAEISDATILDGKLLIAGNHENGPVATSYDGHRVPHNPQNLLKVQRIDGKLLYITEDEDGNEVAVWGDELTRAYLSILSTQIHDRQIVLVTKNHQGKQYIVWGDWVSPTYDEIYDVQTTTPQQLGFTARKGRKVFAMTYKPHRSDD